MITKMDIIRKIFTDKSTIGDFLIDGKWYFYSLEDCDRQRQEDGIIIPWSKDLKIPAETAIPYGTYEVITNYSNRFKKVMPYIKDVPDFSGTRIHNGSFAKNTEGCPLIGYKKATDCVWESKDAFDMFLPLLQDRLSKGKVFITIHKKG